MKRSRIASDIGVVLICGCVLTMLGCGSADPDADKPASDTKALRITEVLSESLPSRPTGVGTSVHERRRVVVRVKNTGKTSADLEFGSHCAISTGDTAIEVHKHFHPTRDLPYGLGVEIGWQSKGEWHDSGLHFKGWQPVERNNERGNNIYQVVIPPGETRSFSCEMESWVGGSWIGDAFRAYLVNPKSGRISEKECVR